MQVTAVFDIIRWILHHAYRNGFMAQKDKNVIVTEGIVKECLPDTRFLLEIDVNGTKHEIVGYLSGKMRMNYIWLAVGDKVTLEISPYDPKIGRIIYRNK